MPKCVALHREGWKLGRPNEVDGFERVDCRRFPLQEVEFLSVGRTRYGGVHSPGKLGTVQKTSRGTAHGRGADSAHEIADARTSERTATSEAQPTYSGLIYSSLLHWAMPPRSPSEAQCKRPARYPLLRDPSVADSRRLDQSQYPRMATMYRERLRLDQRVGRRSDINGSCWVIRDGCIGSRRHR